MPKCIGLFLALAALAGISPRANADECQFISPDNERAI